LRAFSACAGKTGGETIKGKTIKGKTMSGAHSRLAQLSQDLNVMTNLVP
jgi:hypothetical protein